MLSEFEFPRSRLDLTIHVQADYFGGAGKNLADSKEKGKLPKVSIESNWS